MLPAKQRTGWAGHTQAGYASALAEARDSNGPGALDDHARFPGEAEGFGLISKTSLASRGNLA